jgi:hypothetical protein
MIQTSDPARVPPRPAAVIAGLVVLLGALIWPVPTAEATSLFAETSRDGAMASLHDEAARLAGAVLRLGSPLAGNGAREPLEDETLWARRREEPPSAFSLAALEGAADQTTATTRPAVPEEHWSSLPFLGESARRAGYELPLPFGVSVIYNYVARDIEVTDVRIGIDGAPLASISKFANFKARSKVDAAVLRADAWILPFLDVYLLFGYIYNSSETHIRVTVPRPGPLPGTREFTIKTKTELEGFIGGAGMTLAAGYRQLFVTADVNYSLTDLGFDDRFRALIGSLRAGWNGRVGPVPLRLWAGVAYWGTKNTARATTEVPGIGSVRFEADQGPKHPVNPVVGASAALHRHVELFAEYGFTPGDVQFFAGGLTIRF